MSIASGDSRMAVILADTLPSNPKGLPDVQLDDAHSPHKVIAHSDLLRQFVEHREIRPIHIRIGITGACNMRCSFCNFHSPKESDFYDLFSYNDSIATPDAIHLLREFAHCGGRAVTFCGSGECTIHPGYVEICKAAHAEGLQIGLITNGSRLHDEAIRDCIQATHTWVRIGMNAGSAENFAQITRQKPETFHRMLGAIQAIRDGARHPEFRIGLNYVVTAENHHEILQAASLARSSGAHYLRFEPEFYTAHAHESIADVLAVTARLLEEAGALQTDSFEVSIPKLDRGPMDKTQSIEGEFTRCHYSRFVTAVGADGHLYPCPQVHLNSRYRIGDVVKDGYQNVLDGGDRDAWEKSNPLRTDLCKSCFYRPQNELLEKLLSGGLELNDVVSDDNNPAQKTLHADFV